VQPQYNIHGMEVDYLSHKQRAQSLSLFPPVAVRKYLHTHK